MDVGGLDGDGAGPVSADGELAVDPLDPVMGGLGDIFGTLPDVLEAMMSDQVD